MRFCNWATPLCSHQCERNAPSWVQVSFPLHRILFPTDFECLAWICPPCLILLPPSSVSKMMFSLNSVLSINWCYFQLIPFLASLPFTAAVPTKYVHNETLISPRLNGQFRIMNCNSVQGNAIIAALQEIVNVVSTLTFRWLSVCSYSVYAATALCLITNTEVNIQAQTAQTRTSNLYDLLNVVNVNFNAFSPLDQSTYDTFETIFGVELFPQSVTSLGALTLIKSKILCRSQRSTWCPVWPLSICIRLTFIMAHCRCLQLALQWRDEYPGSVYRYMVRQRLGDDNRQPGILLRTRRIYR